MQLFAFASIFFALVLAVVASERVIVHIGFANADAYAHAWSVACNALVKDRIGSLYGPQIQVVDYVYGVPDGSAHVADVYCAWRYTGQLQEFDYTEQVRRYPRSG